MSQLDFCPFGIAKLGHCLWSHTFSPSARQDMLPEISVLGSLLREVYTNVPLVEPCGAVFSLGGPQPLLRRSVLSLRRTPTLGTAAVLAASQRHLSIPHLMVDRWACCHSVRLSRRHRQSRNAPYHRPKQPPRQVAFRQQEPI